MRLPGMCSRCRRPRQVLVSGHALALAQARGGVVEGICSLCEELETAERIYRPGVRVRHAQTRVRGVVQTHPRAGVASPEVRVAWDTPLGPGAEVYEPTRRLIPEHRY